MAEGASVKHVKEEEEVVLRRRFHLFSKGAIRLAPEGYLLPSTYKMYAESIYNFQVKPTDIFVATFPKAGTSWMQEIVWTLLYNPDLNNPTAELALDKRSISMGWFTSLEIQESIISYFHFCKLHVLFGFTGTVDEFVDDFINDRVPYAPYWKNLEQAWEKKEHPNLCFVFYEDLKNDLASEVKRIDKFLGINRTDKQIQNVVHHTSFDQMKENLKNSQPTSFNNKYFNREVEKRDGGFFRKGQVGDWKNKYTSEQMQKINAWMAENLHVFGNDFKYKIEKETDLS